MYKYFCNLSLGLKFGEFYFGFTGYNMSLIKASKIWNKLSLSPSVLLVKRLVCLCLNPPFITSRTSNLRITHAELRTTYAELRRCMWNFCGIHPEFRNALRNSAKVSQLAEFVPHPTSEYFPHLYGKFAENSDLVFLHSGTMQKIST